MIAPLESTWKYCNERFVVKKDNRGRRQYTDSDIMVIEKLIELSKHDGMTLEKTEETDLVPFYIKQQLGVTISKKKNCTFTKLLLYPC